MKLFSQRRRRGWPSNTFHSQKCVFLHFCDSCLRKNIEYSLSAWGLKNRPRTLRGSRSDLGSGRRCFEVVLALKIKQQESCGAVVCVG